METDDIFVGLRHEYGGERPFALGVSERRQHVYAIGQTGAGKSTLLRNLIMQDIEAGRGVALIDPHGDLASDILEQIPPWRTGDVVYFDPASRDPLAINLFRATGDNWHLVASGIVSAFKNIWANSWGARLEYILYATLAALLQCDISMPLMNGLDATQQILKVGLATKIVMLSVHTDDVCIEAAVGSGAMGYLIKHTAADIVCSAIRAVQKGNMFFSPSIPRRLQKRSWKKSPLS